ncbi:MAG TPA: hypothetical protein VJ810_25075 [Blastocatellia bacterium]|nr:hypothetical protein [Blastocatellia bacterium]
MKMQRYNQQLIVRYLLDDLPEEERLQFEDAYLSDHDLFARTQAVEEEMIEDYVEGRLSGPERARFEYRYVETASPAQCEKVEFARTLIAEARARLAEPRARQTKPTPLSWLRSLIALPRIPSPAVGFALATILLLITGSWLFVERSRLQRRLDLARTEATRREQEISQRAQESQRQAAEQRDRNDRLVKELEAAQTQLARLRAESPPPQPSSSLAAIVFPPPTLGSASGAGQELIIRPGVKSVQLICRFYSDAFESGRAVVRPAAGGDSIWDQPGLKLKDIAPGRKAVVVNLPAYLFTVSKDYTLTLSDTTSTGATGGPGEINYRFHVVKQ